MKEDPRMQKTIEVLESDFQQFRTGRASTALFEKIMVESYGNSMPLNQLATLSTPEARTVLIQPWDKSTLGSIEKAIQQSELSINPQNDGKVIRMFIPPLSQERRQEVVKLAKKRAEEAKVAIRNIRRQINDQLHQEEKDKTRSKDERMLEEAEIQKHTDKFIQKIDALLSDKEKEILET